MRYPCRKVSAVMWFTLVGSKLLSEIIKHLAGEVPLLLLCHLPGIYDPRNVSILHSSFLAWIFFNSQFQQSCAALRIQAEIQTNRQTYAPRTKSFRRRDFRRITTRFFGFCCSDPQRPVPRFPPFELHFIKLVLLNRCLHTYKIILQFFFEK